MSQETSGKSRVLQGLGVGLFTTFFALGASELVARAVVPAPPDNTREPHLVYRPDPEIRYVHVPNQRAWIDGARVSINALGFRGPEPALPKPRGRFRIVTIGDSVTLGWGVADDETFSADLERRLRAQFPGRDLDVVNLGVSGYDTRQEVTLLKRYIARLQPDLVLVGFLANDVPEALDDPGPSNAPAQAAGAPERLLQINPGAATGWERVVRNSRVLYTAARLVRRVTRSGEWGRSRYSMELEVLQAHQSPEIDRAWAKVEQQLQELHDLGDANHFEVAVAMLPSREQVDGQFREAAFLPTIKAFGARMGFSVVDPLPEMTKEGRGQQLFIPYDRIHPSAAGHRAIARAALDGVAPYLEAPIARP